MELSQTIVGETGFPVSRLRRKGKMNVGFLACEPRTVVGTEI